jgi:hypothetical protein
MNYASVVEMPGIITDTNAPTVEGNKVTWRGFKSYEGDFEMWVESRVVNWWSLVVTGLIMVLGIAGYSISLVRRRATTP